MSMKSRRKHWIKRMDSLYNQIRMIIKSQFKCFFRTPAGCKIKDRKLRAAIAEKCLHHALKALQIKPFDTFIVLIAVLPPGKFVA